MTNPLAAEAPASRPVGDHLVPLGGGRYGIWRHVLVRSPGFPAEGVARLAAPRLARRADELAAADVSDDEWASYRRLFAEGGDSVAAVHALQLIHQSTGVQLPVAVFFTHPSAGLLAELVAGQTAA